MLLPQRKEPEKIKILRILDKRMGLPPEEKKRYQNLVRGYEGEVRFDSYTAHLESKFYILKGLLLEHNKSKFQIDSLIITDQSLLPCEIKNFTGDYIYKNSDFFNKQSVEKITNPLHQIDRSQTLLRQLLKTQGIYPQISSHVFFVNPSFFLYNAPPDEPIIYPTQIQSFLARLNSRPANLNSHHRQLANYLLQNQINESPYEQLPPYEYNQLRKGPTCGICGSFSVTILPKKIICQQCGHIENSEQAIVRTVEELKLLFPETRITRNLVEDWCQGIRNGRSFVRILKRNFTIMGTSKWTYYE